MKNAGVSLLIAMGTSFLILGLSVGMLASVSRSLERASNLERSNQFFFAAESGAEEAFFHKNSRGAGVEFRSENEIFHPSNSASTTWEIEGRDESFYGLLREGETIQIPLFWDSSTSPTMSAEETRVTDMNDLAVTFYRNSESMNSETKAAFEAIYGNVMINGFNFNLEEAEDKVLIDWSLSRQFESGEPEKFLPATKSDDPCSGATSLLCKNSFSGVSPLDFGGQGKITPCYSLNPENEYNFGDPTNSGCVISFDEFINDKTGSRNPKIQVTFRSILGFTDEKGTPELNDDEKIPGIPYTVTNTGNEIPKPYYTVTSKVEIGNFKQQISIDVKEKTSIGAFDYVIFD